MAAREIDCSRLSNSPLLSAARNRSEQCAQAVQRARLTARGGADSWAVFEARWIPLEETYFKAHAVQALADLTLDTTPFA